MEIGVCGAGFVGSAVIASLYEDVRKEGLVIYDPYAFPATIHCWNELLTCEHIFMCLPTPMKEDGSQDFSIYRDTLDTLVAADYAGILIVKSTMLYKNIQPYLNRLNIVMNPEFLNANTAIEDFKNQKHIVLGGRIDHLLSVQEVYEHYFVLNNKPEYIYCSHKEAIDLKYTSNSYHAMKCLYWNFVQEFSGNQRKIFNMYAKIWNKTEAGELARICADGTPGYSGACFPKDVGALFEATENPLLEAMIKYNKKIRGNVT